MTQPLPREIEWREAEASPKNTPTKAKLTDMFVIKYFITYILLIQVKD